MNDQKSPTNVDSLIAAMTTTSKRKVFKMEVKPQNLIIPRALANQVAGAVSSLTAKVDSLMANKVNSPMTGEDESVLTNHRRGQVGVSQSPSGNRLLSIGRKLMETIRPAEGSGWFGKRKESSRGPNEGPEGPNEGLEGPNEGSAGPNETPEEPYEGLNEGPSNAFFRMDLLAPLHSSDRQPITFQPRIKHRTPANQAEGNRQVCRRFQTALLPFK
jgi:hypothetical protein